MERGRLRRTTTALIIGVSTAWLSVALIGCGGSSGSSNESQLPSQAPIPIGAAGGQVSSADGHATLIVPPNAITTDTIFIIEPAIGAPSSDRIVGTVFDVEPTGTVFSVPAQLTLTYDTLPSGVDANTLQLGTLDQGVWTVVTGSSAVAANKTVTAPITHLSMYTVLQPAATPEPTNHAPTAKAGGPYNGTAGQAVSFNGTGSTDPDVDPLTYVWDFGDQTYGATPTPSHAYGAAGTFHVTLTVSDGRGGTDKATVDAVIAAAPPANHAPTANAGGPYSGTVNEPVTLSAAGSLDPDKDPLTYTWTFGDVLPSSTTTSQTIAHVYSAPGPYTATLTVDDGRGLTATATAGVTIAPPPPSNQPPIANAGGPYTGTAGQTVAFDGSGSSDPDGDPLTYVWDFGDLTSATIAKPTHVYGTEGTFHVTLTVSDGHVGTAATVDAVIAAAPPVNHPPTASITMPSTGPINLPLSFTGFGSDPDNDPLTFSWNFGDGSAANPIAATTHTFATQGTFTVVLTVSDGHGGMATASGTIEITAPTQPPTAVSQQYMIEPRQQTPPYFWRYAVPLNGTGGVPPLRFRITSFPIYQDPDVTMNMIAGDAYQFWDPNTASWDPECRSPQGCAAPAASYVALTPDPTTGTSIGDVTMYPSDSPATVIFMPILCWRGFSRGMSDSFTFVVIDANGNTSDPATITMALDPNIGCTEPSL